MITTAAVPARIGRYEIVRRLGKSMTDVFLAIDTVDQRKAALKLIKSSPDGLTRMVLEAERRGAAIQQQLRALDPRVVEIYEFGDLDGYFFVAMQYIEGRNLAEVLAAESRLEPRRAASVALEICAQLARFHSWQGEDGGPRSTVVHGDVKPSNIHLGPDDTVRLLDFGIAKMLRAGHDATAHDFGSPSYCSPERLGTSRVDPHSDLWAVGATLYEMLAGAPPYQAENTRQLERLIQSRRPPRALPGACPRPLVLVVAKALAPDPARRYRSAADFHDDLERYLDNRPTVAETERRGWSANATIEVAREYLRRATRTLRRRGRLIEIGTAAGWFLTGLVLWVGGSYVLQLREDRRLPSPAKQVQPAPKAAPDLVAKAAPNPAPPDALSAAYLAAAQQVFAAYRDGSNPSLGDYDWQKAEVCFARAIDLGGPNDDALAGRALSRGYLALVELTAARHPAERAAALRRRAKDAFVEAARHAPRSPEPHLALARFYVYTLPDVEAAMREFRAAERLGARLGPREIEQQADAYRLRAVRETAEARRSRTPARIAWFRKHAAQDAAAARRLYERIAGYDKAALHLRELRRVPRWP